MEVEEILRREIAKVVEEKWKENCDDNLIQSLASRSIDPYTVAGKILGEIFSRGL
jgi:LAO/AO transport system kinase